MKKLNIISIILFILLIGLSGLYYKTITSLEKRISTLERKFAEFSIDYYQFKEPVSQDIKNYVECFIEERLRNVYE